LASSLHGGNETTSRRRRPPPPVAGRAHRRVPRVLPGEADGDRSGRRCSEEDAARRGQQLRRSSANQTPPPPSPSPPPPPWRPMELARNSTVASWRRRRGEEARPDRPQPLASLIDQFFFLGEWHTHTHRLAVLIGRSRPGILSLWRSRFCRLKISTRSY
jgi:hypothetical protein